MGRRSGGYAGPNVSAGRLIVYERLLVTRPAIGFRRGRPRTYTDGRFLAAG